MLDKRVRIARELHDGVIQSLFAVASRSGNSEVESRVESAVSDRATRDLRNYISGLRPGLFAHRLPEQALMDLAVTSSKGVE